MSENKLEKLAKILYVDFMDGVESPSDVYTKLMMLVKQQPDYFAGYLGPKNVVKLTILIWSLVVQGNFKLADKIFDTMIFAILISTSGDHPSDTCDECEGNGRIQCEYCYGDGREDCDTCGGDGSDSCDTCDGSGEVETNSDSEDTEECQDCDGKGYVDCSDCGGEGRVECSSCNGEGDFECDTCDGSGEVEDNEKVIYDLTYLITWHPSLIHWFDGGKTPLDPVMETSDLNEFNQHYIITDIDGDESANLKIQEHEYHVVEVDDDPDLGFSSQPRIVWDPKHNALEVFKNE